MNRHKLVKLLFTERLIVSIANQHYPEEPDTITSVKLRDVWSKGLIDKLKCLTSYAADLNLNLTGEKAVKLLRVVKGEVYAEPSKFPDYAKEVLSAFHQETRYLMIYIFDPKKEDYANSTFINAITNKNFPTSAKELVEAGICFAFNRNTASVFHALRSLEMPLKVIAKNLKIKLADNAKGKNWYQILSQIEAALNTSPKKKKEEVQHTLSYLSNVRGPLRNATMHLDKSYDEEEAKDILDTIAMFFKYIPKRFKETVQKTEAKHLLSEDALRAMGL